MKKKLISIIIVTLLFTLISGCGIGKNSKNSEEASVNDIVGVWYEVDVLDSRTLTVNEDATFSLEYRGGGTMYGTVEVTYEEHPDGTKSAWYSFKDVDGAELVAFAKSDDEIQKELFSGQDGELHFYRSEYIDEYYGTESESEPILGMINPWRDCTEEEAGTYVPNGFSAPEGSTNIRWSVCEPVEGSTNPEIMVQLDFDYEGLSYTAREQAVPGTEITDISGLYYEWTSESDGILANWAGGKMPCKFYRYVGEEGYVDLVLWFDIETGYAYSLSTQSDDLDGFDIQAIAEMIYDPDKQFGANMPDDTDELDEYSIEFIKNITEETVESIDITGCDTFTQIVDKALTKGMGYANETICDNDVLLVSSATYDDLEGANAAIDSIVYVYKDGVPYEIGKVTSGGTAYPITVKDGYLYTGSNHWICKYAIANNKLMIMEHIAIVYDAEGNGTYYYDSEDGGDYSNFDNKEAEKIYDKLTDEMMNGTVVNYSTKA